MLSLQGALKVDGFTVFRDVTWTADGGVASAVFWVLPPTPSLHRDPTGRPSIHLTRYLAAPDAVELARGLLLVTVDLGWTEAQDQALRRALAESLPDSGLDEQTLDLRWVPARGGRATLSVFGEVSGGDLVVGGGGPHPLSGVGDHTQSFLVELNADGSALLWTALEQGLAVVHVSYELELEHRLQDVSMRVWCDASGLSDELLSEEDFDPLVLLEARSLAGVELLEDGVELDEGTRSALIDLGRNTLATFLDGPARASDHAVLDLHWTSDQVLSTTVGVSGLLELGLEGSPLEGHRTEVPYDAGFFRTVELGVLVQPFEATSPVHSAEVRVSYASSGGASAMQSFTYGPTGGSDLFRAAWDSSEGENIESEVLVHYRALGEPLHLPPETLQSGELLVVQPDAVGVFSLEVSLGEVRLDRLGTVEVRAELPELELSWAALLDGGTSTVSWSAVTRLLLQPEARLRATWNWLDGSRTEEEWRVVQGGRVWLDSPRLEERSAQVEFLAAGDWEGLAVVRVAVRAAAADADASSPPDLLTLTESGQRKVWAGVGEHGEVFEYEWQATFVYLDGTHRSETEWTRSSELLVVVRDRGLVAVTVDPRLLDLGESLRLARVDLEYADPLSGLESRTAMTLTDPGERRTWSFRVADPQRRTWRSRLSLYPTEGDLRVSPWRESRADFLVLSPLTE